MTSFVSLMLSVLLTFSSCFIGFTKTVQSVFDCTGLPYAFAARGIADLVRVVESKKEQYPEEHAAEKKVFADDTGDDFVTAPEIIIQTETWKAVEVSLESEKTYADPFNDVDIDLVLVNGDVKYTVPGFWDGGNTWKVRFACPAAGEWYYKTVCTDSGNSALDGRTGKVVCGKYSGELEIYRHGFLSTAYGKKYITYDDGTPFFYLGDTHWSLGDETVDMVNIIAGKRASQGFTVWQSEPIGARFNFTDGISENDMAGFDDYDAKFRIIADAGLVHANAAFFYPADMHTLICNFGGYLDGGFASDGAKAYLEKAARYWVARYSAYPVLWTLGQETDNDFYNYAGVWNSENNPYKLLAEYIGRYDPYSHPLSAHMEYSGGTSAYGSGKGSDEKLEVYNEGPDASAFRNVPNHTWFAAQWSPGITDRSDCKVERDFWYNSQGKPVINYEGRYDHLWTKNFGSRMQGWASFLSGMFGYGWGAHDTWSYLNTYDEGNDSWDGVDNITSEEKTNATWEDALEYQSSYQCGYMKNFFSTFDWWNLIPRFDDKLYFWPEISVKSYAASNADNSEMVIYFFSFSDPTVGELPNSNIFGGTLTGRIGSLEPSTEYKYKWFNPITGEFSEEGSFISTAFGTYSIGEKMWNGEPVQTDMVFYMYK